MKNTCADSNDDDDDNENGEDDVMIVITMMMRMMIIIIQPAVCHKRDAKPLEHLKADNCHHENGQDLFLDRLLWEIQHTHCCKSH